MRHLAQSILAAVLLTACTTVGPDPSAPTLPAGLAERDSSVFREGGGVSFSTDPLPARWWSLYEAPRLDALIEEALAANTDLRVAAANLERAKAVVAEVRAATGVATSVTGGVTVAEASSLGDSPPSGAHAVFDAGVGISYEIDVVGRLRRSAEAAAADADAQAASYDLARTTIAANVLAAFTDACATGKRLAIARRSLSLQEQSLSLTERGVRGGIYMPIDVARSRALASQLEAALPPLESARKASLYSLAVLLGRAPADYPPDLDKCVTIPAIRNAIPIGDGADLIRRRPDIRMAERRLAAATARIGVATADLYPRISLGGSLGGTSRSLDDLVDASAFRFGFGPLISWNFPNRQVARARIDQADAAARAALAAFDGSVLVALREAEVALGTYDRDLQENASLAAARDASRRAVDLQAQLSRGGLSTGLERLDAERSLASAESALAASDARMAADRTRIFLALGGAW